MKQVAPSIVTIALLISFATGVLFRDIGQDHQDADRICVSTKPIAPVAPRDYELEDRQALCANDRGATLSWCTDPADVPGPRSITNQIMPPSLPINCETRPAGTFVCS